MTTQICEAVFQDGKFRPVQPISSELAEGQRVRLVVEAQDTDVLSLATSVYDGLSDAEVKEVEDIALDHHDSSWRFA